MLEQLDNTTRRKMLTLFLPVLLISYFSAVISVGDLYQFGRPVDIRLPKYDDETTETQLSAPFPFYGVNYTSLYVSSHDMFCLQLIT